MTSRLGSLRSPAIALAAAGTFFAIARFNDDARLLAVWGGAVWVFFLTTIVTLPLLARRSGNGAG